MRSVDAVRLVAWREMTTRLSSKAFRISTALVSIAVVALIALPTLIGDDGPAAVTVAVDSGHEGLPTFESGARAVATQLDVELIIQRTAPEAIESAIVNGTADVGLVGDEAVWHEVVDEREAAIIRGGVQAVALGARTGALGLSAEDSATLFAPVELATRTIEPPDDDRDTKVATALVGVLLMFAAIQLHGTAVLQGVIEEKSSRVVEILLTHLRASELLAGKTIGIGIVGLVQGAVVMAAALAATSTVNGTDVPELGVVQVLTLLGWFLLGFLLYATGFATAGSLVSRQEDAQAAVAPMLIPFLAAYMISLNIIDHPDNTLGRVVSLVPFTAPLAMPVRIAAGDPSAVEVVVAAVLTALTIVALMVLGGRIYRRNLLRTGARVPWLEALRGVRTDPPR